MDDGRIHHIDQVTRNKRYNGLNTVGVKKQYTCLCKIEEFDIIHEGEDMWVKADQNKRK